MGHSIGQVGGFLATADRPYTSLLAIYLHSDGHVITDRHTSDTATQKQIHLAACTDFPNVVAERKSYVHVASDAIFCRLTQICLCFVSCVTTRQNATFLGVVPHAGGYDPKFELCQNFCMVHLPPKFRHPVFTRLEVIVLTNTPIQKQRDSSENIQRSSLCYNVG